METFRALFAAKPELHRGSPLTAYASASCFSTGNMPLMVRLRSCLGNEIYLCLLCRVNLFPLLSATAFLGYTLKRALALDDRSSEQNSRSFFQVLVPRTFALVCFRVKPSAGDPDNGRTLNATLLENVNKTGKLFFTHTVRNQCLLTCWATLTIILEFQGYHQESSCEDEGRSAQLCSLQNDRGRFSEQEPAATPRHCGC